MDTAEECIEMSTESCDQAFSAIVDDMEAGLALRVTLARMTRTIGDHTTKKLEPMAKNGGGDLEPNGAGARLESIQLPDSLCDTTGPTDAFACLVELAASLIDVRSIAKQEDPATWFPVFEKARSLDKEAREKLKDSTKLNASAFQIATSLRKHIMSQPTEYDLNGGLFSVARKIVMMKPLDLATDLQQLKYLVASLGKVLSNNHARKRY